MTIDEIKELNRGRYTFRSEHSSTKAKLETYRRTPGKVLVEEFLVPYYPAQLSDLAQRAKIPASRLHKLIRGNDKIDVEMATKLSAFFGKPASYFLDIQERFERGEKL